jgi:hypothetical protein
MNRPRLAILPALGFGAALLAAGCSGSRDFEAELGTVRSTTRTQLDVLKKQNELLNRKLNDMNARVDEIQVSNERLSTDLTTYASRPDEIKIEILTEIQTTFQSLAARQQEFEANTDSLLATETRVIAESLEVKLADVDKSLAQHSAFVHFVSSEQDSINRVFANRFDSRPWYQSILGRWEDMQRARTQTP